MTQFSARLYALSMLASLVLSAGLVGRAIRRCW